MDYEVKYYKIYFSFPNDSETDYFIRYTEQDAIEHAKELHDKGYRVQVEKVLEMIIDFQNAKI